MSDTDPVISQAFSSVLAETANHALRAAVLLAHHPNGRSASDIARELAIPKSYLEKVLGIMARAGSVVSSRGARGGFKLGKDASLLTLAEVIAPFDSIGERPKCLLNPHVCGAAEPCSAHALWGPVAEAMHLFFTTNTVSAIATERHRAAELMA
jgi:Rrf2 family protein